MTYIPSRLRYEYTTSFDYIGTYTWSVNCSKPGYDSVEGSDTVTISSAAKGNLTIKLTIPSTTHQVYIPGPGAQNAYQVSSPATWSSPPHYYIASWLANTVYALVHHSDIPVSIGFERTSTDHTLVLTHNINDSKSFLVFTKGNWEKIDKRIPLIEAGTFLDHAAPTFGYGLGLTQAMNAIVAYTNLIDLRNTQILHQGEHTLVIEYVSRQEGNPVLEFRMQ